jgi:hypothetical protein
MQNNTTFIDGALHKLCTGPAHDEPTYLPANEKYFYIRKSAGREGELVSRCRLCSNWAALKSPGSLHGWIPVKDAFPYYAEAVNRIGLLELAKRTGMSPNSFYPVLIRRNKYVQKAKLRLVILELISAKRKNEYSISPYARWRNERRAAGGHGRCSECGCLIANDIFTDACGHCTDRRGKLNERRRAA